MCARKVIEPISWPWYDHKRYSFCMAAQEGKYLFLSGQTASEFDPNIKKMVFKEGIVNQDIVNYDKIKMIIESAGGSMDDIIKETNYFVPSSVDNANDTSEARRKYYKDGCHPAGTTMVIDRLLRPAPLLEVECVAVLGESPKKIINPGWKDHGVLDYSPAVQKEDLLYISGQVGIDHDSGEIIGNDMLTQAEQAYKNVSILLEAAGAGFADVVKTIHYISPEGFTQYQDARKIRDKYFNNNYSAHSEVVVHQNLPAAALVKVDCIAIVGKSEKSSWDLGINRFKDNTRRLMVSKGKLVFLSGVNSTDLATDGFIEGDVVAQTRQSLLNAEKILGAAGLGWTNVLMAVDFIVPEPKTLELYPQTATVRRELFKDALPPSTGVVQDKLIGNPGLLINVDITASLD